MSWTVQTLLSTTINYSWNIPQPSRVFDLGQTALVSRDGQAQRWHHLQNTNEDVQRVLALSLWEDTILREAKLFLLSQGTP